MADAYSAAAVLLAASSLAAIKVSSRFRNVFKRVFTPRLRSVGRALLRAALIADLVFAMVDERLELGKNRNAVTLVKGIVVSSGTVFVSSQLHHVGRVEQDCGSDCLAMRI